MKENNETLAKDLENKEVPADNNTPEENNQERNYAAFIRTVQIHSGKTMRDFCAAAGINENTPRLAIKKGSILLKTARNMLAYNGYVSVFNFTFPATPEYMIVDDYKENPFDVDWTTYKMTDQLRNIYRNDPELLQKAKKTLGLTERAIQYMFQKDTADIKKIYILGECAGLKVRLLIKKDEKAARILVKRIEQEQEQNKE